MNSLSLNIKLDWLVSFEYKPKSYIALGYTYKLKTNYGFMKYKLHIITRVHTLEEVSTQNGPPKEN